MISILIPIYNGIEFIDESVQSVINQTFSDWELLIGINGHPENSSIYHKAKHYESVDPRIKVYDFFHLSGKSNTLNHMITLCKYEYISLLDVDDAWHPKKLELQIQHLEYDVIGSRCVYFGNMNGIVPDIPLGNISTFDFTKVNPIINSSCIIRKEFAFWDSSVDGVEDYDLWLRLRKQGKSFYNCSQILVKHRIHGSSAFNTQSHDDKLQKILSNYSK